MQRRNYLYSIILTTFLLLFMTVQAGAHGAIVWACIKNNHVVVDASYANGKKIQNTRVVVLDENDKVLLEGKTDKDGKFSYRPTTKRRQTIVVIADEGHFSDFELSEEALAKITLD